MLRTFQARNENLTNRVEILHRRPRQKTTGLSEVDELFRPTK